MIWFDLDNSPHVPLFIPVFGELKSRAIPFEISARDFAQTLQLLKLWNIPHTPIGKHGGKNKIMKVLNLLQRAGELKKFARSRGFKLAVSHGSRTQLVAAKKLDIPSVLMLDYEYTESKIFNHYATWLLMPEFIPDKRLKNAGFNLDKLIRYNGFKEELYLHSFKPEKDFRKTIGAQEESILVVIRPPGMMGNYHNSRSEGLLVEAINHFASAANTDLLIVSRSQKDKDFINTTVKSKGNVRFLEKPVDGIQLVYVADYVLSGGGTMNREAALVGAKTYSIFTGKKPYLDEYLQSLGRLSFIETADDIKNIKVARDLDKNSYSFNKEIVKEVTDIILSKIK